MRRLGVWLAALGVLALVTSGLANTASAAAAVDVTPPVIDSLTGPPPAVRPATPEGTIAVSYSWSGHDPDGSEPVTYDLRYGWVDTPAGPSSWLVGFDNASATSWSTTLQWYDPDFCVQVRARDAAGNVSGWTPPLCTAVDQGPPWVWMYTDPAHWSGLVGRLHDGLAATPVSYSYISGDDDQVASFDVDVRIAQPGASYGPWESPASWQATTATTVSRKAPTGASICFRVRARDRAGYVSQYDRPWCRTVPYDDRAFKIHDGAKRVRPEHALGHTATSLTRMFGSMTKRRVHAREIWVRVLGPRSDVCVAVTLDGRHGRYGGGCFLERVPGAVWQGFYFRPGRHGKLRISGDRRRVDAVAFLR